MENLLNCKGRLFRAEIMKTPVEGRIQVEGDDVFLCQDKRWGTNAADKLGYRRSWFVGTGTDRELEMNDVKEFRLIPSVKAEIESFKDWRVGDLLKSKEWDFLNMEVIFRSGELVIGKDVHSGSATSPYTIDDLYEMGYRFVPSKEEGDAPIAESVRELTMDEIAEKFGLPVDRIRVKKD